MIGIWIGVKIIGQHQRLCCRGCVGFFCRR